VEDPYIRATHQIYNFLRFCELVVRIVPSVKHILLITVPEDTNSNTSNSNQTSSVASKLEEIKESLEERNIHLTITYKTTLHDRQIRLNSGWIIKIGRGLDIYQKSKGNFSIGFLDYELRPTLETTVDIFKKK